MKYTLKLKKRCLLLATLLMLVMGIAYAQPDVIEINQIKPGMHGIAKTVVRGTEIEEFGVEVLGVMRGQGPSGDLILVRTYGELIDKTGGIAQGMSGSPVYFDGKLAGAIAYGWPLADHRIAMVTPITEMLKLWTMPDYKNNRPEQKIEGESDKVPVATPIMAVGFSSDGLKFLAEKLGKFNMVPYQAGLPAGEVSFGKLSPGSAVGVELVRGDLSVSALGTVTYVEGDKVLAFGHPFIKKGNVGYFMTNAYIYTVVNGLENSFKVGVAGEAIGTINQDRGSGIAGRQGVYPYVIPVRIEVTDKQLNRNSEYAIQVVDDEQLSPILAAASVFNLISRTIDRGGAGTAAVEFEILAKDMPGGTFKRQNMFYSPTNIAEAAVGEFYDIMALLAANQYNPVDVVDVNIKVSVDCERRTATIIDAKPERSVARPGEKVNIIVKLKPYRGEPVTRTVQFTVPNDQPDGVLSLDVRGGGVMPLTKLLLKKQGLDEEFIGMGKKNKSFDEVLKEQLEADRNNDIVVEYGSAADLDALDIMPAKDKKKTDVVKPKPAVKKADSLKSKPASGKGDKKSSVSTDYIVDGYTSIYLTVNSQIKQDKTKE